MPKSYDPMREILLTEEKLLFVFVGDNAFPLAKYCLKPYPDKALTDRKWVFNYKLSRFRGVSENAFGNLSGIFRIFTTEINLPRDTASSIVIASLALHNLLGTKSSDSYTPAGFVDEIIGADINEG